MEEKLLKPYNPKETEERIYKLWEDSGFFNPDNLPDERHKSFTIVMPPPNANGDLHAGHTLFITLEDIMIRYKRMAGFKTLWLPGADHAGFETQVVYEKKLEKEGRSRFGMDPNDLYKEILDFTLLNKKNMETQVRSLGASCDWSREKFTLDPDVVEKTQDTFVKMYNDKIIYRGKRAINWCYKHQTSLSEVETESSEELSPLFYLKYGPFSIATVRPETKFGDKYVVMHPDDKRYAEYKHGQKIKLEWINGPIEATIIKDEAIDMEFGTGVMTITPWHSQIDFEIAKRHDLDTEQIIDWRGKLLGIANEFAGMNIKDARAKIVEKLKAKGLLIKIDEKYQNVIKKCYKCGTVIEPQIKDQWFVKMAPLTKLALNSVNRGEIKFIPDNYEKIFRYWMENSIDWNISRQIVWGIPIPAWFKGEEFKVSKEKPNGEGWTKDPDTFDTWFSSGQWPLMTTGFPKHEDFKKYYPTDVMETGHDLIFKWVPRMVIFGLYLAQKAPFHTVYLHGLVNDAQGKKMSKSKGNVINPLTLTDKYGTDALRMALIVGNTPGTDLALQENKVKGYKHFANKIWNITRFVLDNTKDVEPANASALIDECNKTIKDVTEDMENFRFYLASEKLYHYLWHRYADEIIEESKKNEEVKKSLFYILENSLKLLHPFMPFITEEIWSILPARKNLLMVEKWPLAKLGASDQKKNDNK
ncbi:valine--tRNA ligase [Candidatus Nomurabacteria bacterium RIFCSPHIGHO2_01_FULL_37_25]|uniref:Valine--tRNA ligase n=1 Tax=Candidatus Nomurabacteria bacterium RIFCSPLOWO2_01_FULL_36_16 TaxID=1801767 RepID=A0A1F6X0Q7_9BACT|nr:MAG: valine--tRNA ligase [Candidatus Nomurabacteria bacterium RIFCSPHIGHO2_01_FULL_37_25]OGI75044.1 MAG: valine--tRNA ligase [Candidatus Nomurabacteria bacterium RIFCSPHIGHO2_02_FULL_36_29]OGI87555.1 MAG: valine--tRNA ligase [Candidatus Nomurabacteria bacterium RIFCSPLOWO2_01_FULL_36_16]OGI96756.1 MAG: valine--tRNA ligase [Candidatus Nomurabacteria bacterium RIFCSPLOWO2_02_FULL_36_8]